MGLTGSKKDMREQDGEQPKLDAGLAAFLQLRAQHFPAVDLTELPLDEGRRLYEARCQFGQSAEPPCRVEDRLLPLPSGRIRARLYRPLSEARPEAILYFHGGGWIFGGIETHDGLMRGLCRLSGVTVVGVDYRLAPEAPFPEPLKDCVEAFRWLQQEADALGIAPEAITIAGDSAGACLALSAGQELAGRDGPEALMLLYGCYAPMFSTDSHRAYGDGRFGLSTMAMQRYWQHYTGGSSETLAAPLKAKLEGLPPLYLGAAGLDPLRDDSLLLAERLADAGLRFRLDVWEGCTHGFLQLPGTIPAVASALSAAVAGWKAIRSSADA